mmetsp:Transcript_37207/g.81004  ORF Transcript_37207/g.81004 Transcript_37207/m.81004 type:complete len:240 (-) Transcript_37207:106-825(-)
MLYIGPWFEYELAKLLVEQQTSSRNSKPPTLLSDSSLNVGRSTPSSKSRTARRNDAVISDSERRPPVISQPQRTRNSNVEAYTRKTKVNNCSQRSNPFLHPQRPQYSCGEAKSMRQLRNELLSFRTQNAPAEQRSHKTARGRSSARSRKPSTPIDKRVSQVQRMQQIYKQGKAIAEQEKKSRGLASKRSEYSNRHSGDNLRQHTSLSRSSPPQNKDASLGQLSEDDLISWAGALDIENI